MIRARRNKRRRKKKKGRKKREMIGVQLARRFCIAIYRRWIYGRFADKLVKCGRTGTWVRRSFTRAPNLGTGRRGCIYIYIYIYGEYIEWRSSYGQMQEIRGTYGQHIFDITCFLERIKRFSRPWIWIIPGWSYGLRMDLTAIRRFSGRRDLVGIRFGGADL